MQKYSQELIDEIKKYSMMDRLVVFVGAGVSRCSGLPSWNELVVEMADEIHYKHGKTFSSDELIKIPQIFEQHKGHKLILFLLILMPLSLN